MCVLIELSQRGAATATIPNDNKIFRIQKRREDMSKDKGRRRKDEGENRYIQGIHPQ